MRRLVHVAPVIERIVGKPLDVGTVVLLRQLRVLRLGRHDRATRVLKETCPQSRIESRIAGLRVQKVP